MKLLALVLGLALAIAPAAWGADGTVSRSTDGSAIVVGFGDAGDSPLVRSTGLFPNGSVVLDENSVPAAGTKLTPAVGSGCTIVDDANDDDVICTRSTTACPPSGWSWSSAAARTSARSRSC